MVVVIVVVVVVVIVAVDYKSSTAVKYLKS